MPSVPTKELSNLDLEKGSKKHPKKQSSKSTAKDSAPPPEWTADHQTDYDRILSIGEECNTPPELRSLLLTKGRGSAHPTGITLYDGFEPSGRMHIAQGVFKAMNVNKATVEGTNSTFCFWVADWFALMNDKMGGDLQKIQIVGQYLQEVWKAAGMNLNHVEFKWASEEITQKAHIYWPIMLDVARRFNITRIKKCCQIMGRLEGNLSAAQVLYPLMQCTDIFFLKADICQLGVDQRKVNMLAREYCIAAKKKVKPVILSHHMLYGLKEGQEKMSKSDPDSAVFMEDPKEDVERKIMAAYCPVKPKEKEKGKKEEEEDAGKESMHLKKDDLENPCLDYIQHIILSPPNATFTANGKVYSDFDSIKTDFVNGILSEQALKQGLIAALNQLLQPVRDHFTTNEQAKSLLEQVQQFKREGNSGAQEKILRRLNLVEAKKVPAQSHLVLAPLPVVKPTLNHLKSTIAQLQAATEGQATILYLRDWTARVCNSCDADVKAIDAFYTIFLTALKALEPELMENVSVWRQSDAILHDPSNYWISVINVGRHFNLNQVMGSNLKDADGVGAVIGRMMLIGDVIGFEPQSIAFGNGEDSETEMDLIGTYFDEKLTSLTKPTMLVKSCPDLALQQVESEAHKTENYEYTLMDDPKVHGKSKMKKAFCEPGNVDFCPPIVLACMFGPAEIVINRSEENGGNVTYSTQGAMEEAFKSGALHPGDLKATASAIMLQTLEKLSAPFKVKNSEEFKASKALTQFAKKMAKKKK